MTGYRKTITVVLAAVLMAASTPAQTKNSETDEAGQKELYNYVLTMDKIQKIASATQALQVLAKQHPELNDGGSAKESRSNGAKVREVSRRRCHSVEKRPDAARVHGRIHDHAAGHHGRWFQKVGDL